MNKLSTPIDTSNQQQMIDIIRSSLGTKLVRYFFLSFFFSLGVELEILGERKKQNKIKNQKSKQLFGYCQNLIE